MALNMYSSASPSARACSETPLVRVSHLLQLQASNACSGAAIEAVIAEYPWSRYKRFLDIAGAYGSFLARLLSHVKGTEGVLSDQPQVRALAAHA